MHSSDLAHCGSDTSRTPTIRRISCGEASACGMSACACGGWQLAARSSPRLSIDFDRYVAGQQFLGMSALVLDNALKDPSMIRERTSMAFIRRMGQPAPRESFARVYINGSMKGSTQWSKPSTRVSSRGSWETGWDTCSSTSSWTVSMRSISATITGLQETIRGATHRLEADSTLYAPIQALFHEVNSEVDGVWRERVGWFIDLPQFVTHVAIEMFLAEVDGFLGYAGMANFYLSVRSRPTSIA